MGKMGNYGFRAFWRRLGMTNKLRDRVFEVSGTDPVNIAIMTVSDTRTPDTDTSGQYLEDTLLEEGHALIDRVIVKDDIYQLRAQVSQWIADPEVQAVLVTGGTGFSGRDSTPEALAPLFDKHIEGFGETFRALSFQEIGSSTLQSRAFAGLANRTVIFCMPGSTGAYIALSTQEGDGWTANAEQFQIKCNHAARTAMTGTGWEIQIGADERPFVDVRTNAPPAGAGRRLTVSYGWAVPGENAHPGDRSSTLQEARCYLAPFPEACVWMVDRVHLDSADAAVIPSAPSPGGSGVCRRTKASSLFS
jgi:molybdenum cofactor biosynthesis protein B